jgi:putative endonuclease
VTSSRQALGARGEERAAAWYEANGYEVVARNWRCREGEIDVVARRDGTTVFCEVKTRTSSRFGVPAEAVGWEKQRRLRRLAARYLAQPGARSTQVRFDVASILEGHLHVIEDAF